MNRLYDEKLVSRYKKQIQEKYQLGTDELKWQTFTPGECIYEQGFPLPYLCFLVKGKVKIYSTSEAGKRLIVTFNKPLELYGEIELVQNIDTIHTIEAVTTVHIGILPLEVAEQWRKDAVFNELLLQSISRKFLTKSKTLSFHLLHDAEVRLASYLASICHDEDGNFIKTTIPKSELKNIAEFIGITVRHQNRCLQHFEQAGIIKRVSRFIEILNPKKLIQIAKENIYEIQ